MFGFTQNYVKVKYPFDNELCNTPITITVGDFDEEGNMSCSLAENISV
jgi:hypothetical protein